MAAPQQQPPFAQPAPQLPQPLPPVPVQQIMLPPGAQLYNGGVLYHTNGQHEPCASSGLALRGLCARF